MKAIPKRSTNPFLSDEENEKSNVWNQELEHSNSEHDLTSNNYEDDKLIVCYKEGAFHVKDICVDEGVRREERILFDENNNQILKPELLKVSTTEDLQHSTPVSKERGTNEEVVNAFVTSELKETSKDDISNVDGLSGSETVSKVVDHNGPDISLQPGEEQINSSGISSLHQGRALPSLKSLFESDQQPFQSPLEKVLERLVESESAMEENATSNLNKEPHDVLTVDELSKEPDDVIMVNSGGEADSSFSVAGPIAGLVTYSGHIGNISLRSDSSTTSTQSFAFPILQNEWNSSPVRMAKADQRRLQKHHGWRHGLLCCRF